MQLNGRKLQLNGFQHFWRQKFRNHFQQSIAVVSASQVLVTYSWLHVERICV